MPRPATLTPKKQAIIAHKVVNPNMSERAIAKLTDSSNARVHEVLAKYNLNHSDIQDFKENQTDILRGLQSKILSCITSEDIQKASLQQKLTGYGILADKLMDLSGESRVVPMVTINMMSVERKPVEVIELSHPPKLSITEGEIINDNS